MDWSRRLRHDSIVGDWSQLVNLQNETKSSLRPRPHRLPDTPKALIDGLDSGASPARDQESSWSKPQDIWTESGWLYWVDQWILASDEKGSDAFGVTFLDGVDNPPAGLFSDFLDLMFKKDPSPIAMAWGPLGRCACNWNGRPDSWWRSLHPSHEIAESRWTKHGFEVLQIRQESLRTWEWTARRAWNAYRLAEEARSVGGSSEAATAIGRPWPENQLFRESMVEVEMLGWGRLVGSLNPHFRDSDESSRKGLLKWIANQVVQHPTRLCANVDCHSRFEPARNQRYCQSCQREKIPARNRKRAARRKRAIG